MEITPLTPTPEQLDGSGRLVIEKVRTHLPDSQSPTSQPPAVPHDDRPALAENDLVSRCVERRWGVSALARDSIVRQLVNIIESTGTKDKDRIRAFRALVEAERLDLEAVKTAATVAAIKRFSDSLPAEKHVMSDAELQTGVALLLEDRREQQAPADAPIRIHPQPTTDEGYEVA